MRSAILSLAVALSALLLSSCVSVSVHPWVNGTLPFHAHQSVYVRAPVVAPPSPVDGPRRRVGVQPLLAYYPMPVALEISRLDRPSRRSWRVMREQSPAEDVMTRLFADALATGAEPELVLDGVIVELSHYTWDGGAAGVVATRLALTDASGAVVARQALRTVAQAASVEELLALHVLRSLDEASFASAIRAGGGEG